MNSVVKRGAVVCTRDGACAVHCAEGTGTGAACTCGVLVLPPDHPQTIPILASAVYDSWCVIYGVLGVSVARVLLDDERVFSHSLMLAMMTSICMS